MIRLLILIFFIGFLSDTICQSTELSVEIKTSFENVKKDKCLFLAIKFKNTSDTNLYLMTRSNNLDEISESNIEFNFRTPQKITNSDALNLFYLLDYFEEPILHHNTSDTLRHHVRLIEKDESLTINLELHFLEKKRTPNKQFSTRIIIPIEVQKELSETIYLKNRIEDFQGRYWIEIFYDRINEKISWRSNG